MTTTTLQQYDAAAVHAFATDLLKRLDEVLQRLPGAKEPPAAIDQAVIETLAAFRLACDVAQLRVYVQVFDLVARLATQVSSDPAKLNYWRLLRELLVSVQLSLQTFTRFQVNIPMRFTSGIIQAATLLQQPLLDTDNDIVAASLFMPYTPVLPLKDTKQDHDPVKYRESLHANVKMYKALFVKFQAQSDKAILREMRQALVSLEFRNKHIGYSAFFEASIAFMDLLINNTMSMYPPYYAWALSAIQQQLDRLLTSTDTLSADDRVLSVLLYSVASPAILERTARMSHLISDLKLTLYYTKEWDVTPKMQSQYVRASGILAEAISSYRKPVPNTPAITLTTLQEDFKEFADRVADLPLPSTAFLAKALAGFVANLQQHTVSETVVDTLILAVLAECSRQFKEGEDPAAVDRFIQQLNEPGESVTVSAADGGKQLWSEALRALLGECKKQYATAEQAFANWHSQYRDVKLLPEVLQPLNAVASALAILTNEKPHQVFELCHDYFKVNAAHADEKELSLRLVLVGDILNQLSTAESFGYQAADKVLTTWAIQDHSAGDAVEMDPLNDRPILDYFDTYMQELTMVLQTMKTALPKLDTAPFDPDDTYHPLVIFRRACHTLKGTSRMVQLVRIGEVAWRAEEILNKVIKRERRLLDDKETQWAHALVALFETYRAGLEASAAADKANPFVSVDIENMPMPGALGTHGVTPDAVSVIVENPYVEIEEPEDIVVSEQPRTIPVAQPAPEVVPVVLTPAPEAETEDSDAAYTKTMVFQVPSPSPEYLAMLQRNSRKVAEEIAPVHADEDVQIDAPEATYAKPILPLETEEIHAVAATVTPPLSVITPVVAAPEPDPLAALMSTPPVIPTRPLAPARKPAVAKTVQIKRKPKPKTPMEKFMAWFKSVF